MESIDFWKLSDNFTIVQATLLILDIDPTGEQEWVLKSDVQNRPDGFDAIYSGIMQAIINKKLKATIRYSAYEQYGYIREPSENERSDIISKFSFREDSLNNEITRADIIYQPEPNWFTTTIYIEDLKQWLLSRNFTSSKFFFGEKKSNEPDYMNTQHPRYSARLAAAVKVWQAMEDEELLSGKGVIDAMKDWLGSRYRELGLIYDNKCSQKAVENCATVANWSKGGAPTTPEKAIPPTP